mmetsp:Transcript_2896/g.6218  ORF Transcript_2896/g.6218 Transcript_2896/m.6218 type:complete len:117 (-) Transcript_2896:43-393(-)
MQRHYQEHRENETIGILQPTSVSFFSSDVSRKPLYLQPVFDRWHFAITLLFYYHLATEHDAMGNNHQNRHNGIVPSRATLVFLASLLSSKLFSGSKIKLENACLMRLVAPSSESLG